MNELLSYIKAKNEKTISWVNEDPQNRFATTLLEDVDFWNGQGVHTVAQFKRYDMETTIWDLYKDVHGIRPRWLDFDAMSDAELEAFYDSLLVDLEEENQRRAIEQAQAIENFEALIAELIDNGAGNRETAIRWLRQADEWCNHDDNFCYEYGLPYGYLKKEVA
jgi:hypothetical protein